MARRRPVAPARFSATARTITAPRTGLAAAVGIALVLALKITLALTLASHPLLQPEGDLDAAEYWRLAQRVAGGDVLLHRTPFYVSPLYIYWLAVAQVLTGGSVAGVLALQAAVGTAGVWLTARTASRWSAPPGRTRAGLVAGGALALTSIVALQDALILQSSLDACLMAAFALALTHAMLCPSARAWLWCGSALALLATNRPNAWLLAVVVAGGASVAGRRGVPSASLDGQSAAEDGGLKRGGRRRPQWLAAVAVGVAIVLAPLAVRARAATGHWQVLPAHGGLNLYIGNHPGATGTYTVVDGIRPSIAGQREDMRRVAEAVEQRPLTDSEVSSHFVHRAAAWWAEAPAAAGRLLLYKLRLALHAWELPVNNSHAWFREQVWLLWLLPVGAWLLVPAGLAACVGGHLVVDADSRDGWRSFRWLLPAYLVSVAIFFVVDRYRAPALVLGAIHLGVLASMQHRAGSRPQGRGAVAALITAAAVLLAGVVPLPFQRGEAEADAAMAMHAIATGRDADAESWLRRATARHLAPGTVWFRAGLGWQSRDDLPRAERAFREARRHDPEVADVAFALAGVLLSQGRGGEAVPLLQQAERAGVQPHRVRLDLALAYWQSGDRPAARAALAPALPSAALPLLRARAIAAVESRRVELAEWLLEEHRRYVQDDAEVAEKLGLMKAQVGDVPAAVALLQEAMRLDPARATVRFNLAVIEAQRGRRREAIALLQESLRIDPSYAQAAGALQELAAPPLPR